MGDGPELISWTATTFSIIPMAFSSSSFQRRVTEHLTITENWPGHRHMETTESLSMGPDLQMERRRPLWAHPLFC